jgi:signal peptidase II
MTSASDSLRSARLRVAAVAVAVIIVDQATKHWALNRLSDDRTIDLVGSLRFNLAFNEGMAFSQGQGLGRLISLVAIVVVVVLLWRPSAQLIPSVATGAIVGGAVGNVIDRAFRGDKGFLLGGVVDFIDLQWWPIFNIADMGVVVGALTLVLVSFRSTPAGDSAEPQNQVAAASDAPVESDPG